MKIFLSQDRKNKLHLIDYISTSGFKYAICGQMYGKYDIINLLAIDGALHNICRKCYEEYEDIYKHDLEKDLRFVKSYPIKEIIEIKEKYDFLQYDKKIKGLASIKHKDIFKRK